MLEIGEIFGAILGLKNPRSTSNMFGSGIESKTPKNPDQLQNHTGFGPSGIIRSPTPSDL